MSLLMHPLVTDKTSLNILYSVREVRDIRGIFLVCSYVRVLIRSQHERNKSKIESNSKNSLNIAHSKCS